MSSDMNQAQLEDLRARLVALRDRALAIEFASVHIDTDDTDAGEFFTHHTPERYARTVTTHLKLVRLAEDTLFLLGSTDYVHGLLHAVTEVVVPFVKEGEETNP